MVSVRPCAEADQRGPRGRGDLHVDEGGEEGFKLQIAGANKWKDTTCYGISEWIKTSGQGGISDDEYTAEVRNFNPVNFDANAIAKPAKDTGMKYINIPSKHHDGFAMYDSKSNDFNFKSFCTHSPIHSRFVAFK